MEIGKFFSMLGPNIYLYLGPETILPLGSVLAALIGVILIGWRWIFAFFRKLYYKLTGKTPMSEETRVESTSDEVTDEINS